MVFVDGSFQTRNRLKVGVLDNQTRSRARVCTVPQMINMCVSWIESIFACGVKKNQTLKMSRNKQYVIYISPPTANNNYEIVALQFSTNIHTIHSPVGKPSIIVYENGYSECLEIGLTKRKDVKPSLLDQGETVAKSYLEVVKNQTILVLCTSGNKVWANSMEIWSTLFPITDFCLT